MFSFFSDTDFSFSLKDQEIIAPVLEKILTDHQYTADYVNVIFMDDEQLLSINKEFLQHDYYTDIITFPYNEEGEPIEAELYISIDRVKENALLNKVSLNDELYRVLIHGVLHLVGFDDSSNTLKDEMHLVEDKYIKLICFT